MAENMSVDSTGRKKSFGRVFERFADKTSMTGVNYINSAKLRTAKFIWGFLLLAAIAAMIYHLFFLCDQFFVWPKITKVSLGFSDLALPAVTICNVNPFLKSNLANVSERLSNLVKGMDPDKYKPTAAPSSGRKRRFVNDFENFNYTEYLDYDFRERARLFKGLGPQNKKAGIKQAFHELFLREPRTLRRRIGHNLVNMLLGCSFKGRTCTTKDFTIFQTKEYGNCYTIQSPYFTVDLPGPSDGLELIMLAENAEYLDGITDGYGMRVAIHPQGMVPYPYDQGFFISTATETHVALRLVTISRLGLPYGNCTDGTQFLAEHNLNYSRSVCNSVCAHDLMTSRCGCYTSDQEEMLVYAKKQKEFRLCKSRKEAECQAEVQKVILAKSHPCYQECHSPCEEKLYIKAISQRQWPTDDYTYFLMQSVCERKSKHAAFVDYCSQLLAQDMRQRNLQFLKLVIYFEDLNYESIVEKEEIEVAQFASDVGGALGLWIGLSVLSVFELFQLCAEMCDYGCYRCRNPRHKSDRAERYKTEKREDRQGPHPKSRENERYDNYDRNIRDYYEYPNNRRKDDYAYPNNNGHKDDYWDMKPDRNLNGDSGPAYFYRGRQNYH